jgi:geranylgeranyl diphosphate synthase, type I
LLIQKPLTQDLAGLTATIVGRVDRRLVQYLCEQRSRWQSDPGPFEAIAELTMAGGKRVRPECCALGYLIAGGEPDAPEVVDLGAALELLHACALIHDDIMDQSPLRRGLAAVHAAHSQLHRKLGWSGEPGRYGESVALLAGDLALVCADRMLGGLATLAPRSYPRVREIWDELRIELIMGQYLETTTAARGEADQQLIRWIASCKSGRYTIARPLTIGATLALGNGPDLRRTQLIDGLFGFGLAIGEAFQLRDDLIDLTGDPQVTGKPAGQDLANLRMTALVTTAIDADPELAGFLHHPEGIPADQLRARLEATGAPDRIERRIAELVDEATSTVAALPISPAWAKQLTALAHRMAYRAS